MKDMSDGNKMETQGKKYFYSENTVLTVRVLSKAFIMPYFLGIVQELSTCYTDENSCGALTSLEFGYE